jgi:ribosomal protein S18 acetylase RimI-like enzyme
MMISCFIGETLVGNAQISIRHEIKTAHRATLALAVLQEVWGLGIGSALMREMIAFAEKRCLLQLELSFMEGNTRAEMLYQKMGFTAVSENPNAYRLKDGSMKNEIFMIKSL